ncbi:MAG: hypothetical protein CFE23_04075 [Flavobacterium sp. BFFFF1]|uniref:DUF6252 family protein n=1 Tax=Flavobacterium sp. BFFFF1 TaxID=2015557 RepID=UPI000BD68240|nr:DUF6252 family protein [Flavobacterium sp. BFFFF1]OYU81654.1 MAG: hypothetical protein CFE23_04075 [Flavobacterium sp. BFFFF1]
MKTLKMISKIALFTVMFIAFSCSSDSDGGGGATASAGTITASIAGSGFTSIAAATQAERVSAGGTTTITLLGANASGKTISLILNGVSAAGTYDIGGDNLIAIVGTYVDLDMQNPQGSPTYVAPTEGGAVKGSITISELTDTKIVGTFRFTGTNQNNANDTKEITNGAFNLEFN